MRYESRYGFFNLCNSRVGYYNWMMLSHLFVCLPVRLSVALNAQGCHKCFLPPVKNVTSREICACGGGLLVTLVLSFFLSPMGRHTLLHTPALRPASQAGQMRNPRDGTGVV